MRTVRLVGHQKAAVQRSSGAHPFWQCRCGFHDVRPAQTVAVRPDLLFLVHLALRVQERNVSNSVSLCRTGREERRDRSAIFLSVGWIVGIVEGYVEHRSPGRPVEEIRYERRISFGGYAFAEVADYGTKARRVVPHQYSRMATF